MMQNTGIIGKKFLLGPLSQKQTHITSDVGVAAFIVFGDIATTTFFSNMQYE